MMTQLKIGCYWWVTSAGLRTECKHSVRPVHWPPSGTECQFCGNIMAYADSEANAELLHENGHDIAYRHQA